MAVSGWCSTHGRPQCERCRSTSCGCECHGAELAQQSGLQADSPGDLWENDSGVKGRCERTLDASTNTHLLRGRARRGR